VCLRSSTERDPNTAPVSAAREASPGRVLAAVTDAARVAAALVRVVTFG